MYIEKSCLLNIKRTVQYKIAMYNNNKNIDLKMHLIKFLSNKIIHRHAYAQIISKVCVEYILRYC